MEAKNSTETQEGTKLTVTEITTEAAEQGRTRDKTQTEVTWLTGTKWSTQLETQTDSQDDRPGAGGGSDEQKNATEDLYEREHGQVWECETEKTEKNRNKKEWKHINNINNNIEYLIAPLRKLWHRINISVLVSK